MQASVLRYGLKSLDPPRFVARCELFAVPDGVADPRVIAAIILLAVTVDDSFSGLEHDKVARVSTLRAGPFPGTRDGRR